MITVLNLQNKRELSMNHGNNLNSVGSTIHIFGQNSHPVLWLSGQLVPWTTRTLDNSYLQLRQLVPSVKTT